MSRVTSLAIFFLGTLALSQCAHLAETEEAYTLAGGEPELNGARFTAELLPTEGQLNYSLAAMVYVTAGETETGPYKCLFTAWGKRGVHRNLTVHRLTFTTRRGTEIRIPSSGPLPFAPGREPTDWQATFVVPELLDFDHAADGTLSVEADVTLRSRERSVRRTLRLQLQPERARNVRFVSIIEDLRGAPADDDSGGAESDPWH